MEPDRWVVEAEEAGVRLDRFLASHCSNDHSRTAVQRAIRAGQVSVNGQAGKVNRVLKPGDAIVARLEQSLSASREAASLLAEPLPLEIVYEDEALLVVNKPAGLVTHPAVGHWTGTLVNAVLWHLQQHRGNAPESPLPRAGIVHRLDKDTFGLLVVAKTDAALWRLSQQLQSREMSRRYLAVVEGHLPFDEGTVDAAIGRHHRERQLMAVRYLGGRTAVSHYRVLRRFDWSPERLAATVVEVSLETGRTHQIRVHLAHLGHPVLGDVTYGRSAVAYWHSRGIGRHWLHAHAIRFQHPVTEAPVELSVPPPPDLAEWLARVLGGAAAARLLQQMAAPPRRPRS